MWELLGAFAGAILSNLFGVIRENGARQANYEINEQAAQNADARTRALYNDISSPSAQKAQIEKAGLSPSLFYSGGVAGSSGMSGAMAAGASGINPNVYGISAQEIANIKNINADTKLKQAEEQKTNAEAQTTNLLNEVQEINNQLYKWDIGLKTLYFTKPDGTRISAYEYAQEENTYDAFKKRITDAIEEAGMSEVKDYINTEKGANSLWQIYLNANRYETQIQALSTEKTSSKYNESLIKALNAVNAEGKTFAEWSAESALSYLKQNVTTNELTEEQKGAWQRLLDKLGKKESSTRDMVLILGMILNQAATHWHMPTINTGDTSINVTKP